MEIKQQQQTLLEEIKFSAYEKEVIKQVKDLAICLNGAEGYDENLYEEEKIESIIKNLTIFYKEITGRDTYPLPEDIKIEDNGDGDNDYWELYNWSMWIKNKENQSETEIEIVCSSYDRLKKILEMRCKDDEELFYYNSNYITHYIKDEYKYSHHTEIDYCEPDLECDDEDIPLYDCDDCPICMEKFGINETTHLIRQKVVKTIKNICVKRNTYCGHPLCIECFKNICNSNKVCCPICREDYEESGDVMIHHREIELDNDTILEMIEEQDHRLLEVVDIEALVEQSITADGYEHLLHLDGFCNTEDRVFWGCNING